jgi:hypothetical protein
MSLTWDNRVHPDEHVPHGKYLQHIINQSGADPRRWSLKCQRPNISVSRTPMAAVGLSLDAAKRLAEDLEATAARDARPDEETWWSDDE